MRRCVHCDCVMRYAQGVGVHACEHGEDHGHRARSRKIPLSRRMWKAEVRRAAEQFNVDWDRAWAIHENGVDER